MKIEVDCTLTKDNLYDFAIYNIYTKLSGFLVIISGISIIFLGLIGKFYFEIENWKFILYVIFGLLIIAYTPFITKYRIYKIPEDNEIFKNKVYVISDEGIVYKDSKIEWKDIERYVRTPKNIGLYYGTDKAIIFSKDCIMNCYENLNKIIMLNLDINKVLFS